MNEQIQKLAALIKESNKIVFFGGAGVSTESGIPDFRSVDGIYNQKYDYPPEIILSHTFFIKKPNEFYRFYYDKMLPGKAVPNACHNFLARLENEGKLLSVITQNIDGLHQKAGSVRVHELHGSVHRNKCMRCGKSFSLSDIIDFKPNVPKCSCGGTIKPEVVLYEESLPNNAVINAVNDIESADTLIVGGTSLNVYPAAGFLDYFSGRHLVQINLGETPLDKRCELNIKEKIGLVMSEVDRLLY